MGTENYVFLNKEFLPAGEAKLHITDLSILRGYGIFDFLKTIDNIPVFLEEHLSRFSRSAQRLGLAIPYEKEKLTSIIEQLINKNDIPISGIRLTLTGGYSTDGFTPSKPNLIITQQPLQLPTEEAVNRGLKLITHPYQRQIPQVKTLDYLTAIWLQPVLKEKGADDILYHTNGIITECPRANIFFVLRNNKLITPRDHILEGITRNKVLALAGKHITEQKSISIQDLEEVQEAFITSTTKGVFPVFEIDGHRIGKTIGPLTKKIYNALNQIINNYIHSPHQYI